MIRGRVDGIKSIENLAEHIHDIEGNLHMYEIQLTEAIYAGVSLELRNLLGKDFSEFSVSVENIGTGMSVTVEPTTDKGRLIFFGAQPHVIDSKDGTGMPVGGDKFATRVNHPGSPGKAEQIYEAVSRAVQAALLLMGSFRGRI